MDLYPLSVLIDLKKQEIYNHKYQEVTGRPHFCHHGSLLYGQKGVQNEKPWFWHDAASGDIRTNGF